MSVRHNTRASGSSRAVAGCQGELTKGVDGSLGLRRFSDVFRGILMPPAKEKRCLGQNRGYAFDVEASLL
jgi:hypothetical protein